MGYELSRRVLATGALLLAASSVAAADWVPTRPIRLVVPFAAGGPTDAMARTLAEALRPRLGTTVIVENRGGAGGNLGAAEVARSDPDGYTLLFGTSGPLAINVSLYRSLSYDPLRSFDPIITLGSLPNVLTVNPKVPARSLQEFVAYARTKPNAVFFASSGNGASSHLAGVLFNRAAGTELKHVPYRGTGPALNDLVAGHVEASFTDVLTAQPQIQAGNIVPIGVTTRERSAALPSVPTLEEQGLAGFDVSVFFGIVVPKGTSPDATKALHAAFRDILDGPAVQALLTQQGIIRDRDTRPERLTEFMGREIEKWRDVVTASGAQLD